MTVPTSGHRVEAVPGSEHVRVSIDGRPVADSTRPILVHETGLPVRYYLPPEDVDLDLFEPTSTHTTCPFKGVASYWTYRGSDGGEGTRTDVAWAYPDPLDSIPEIKGYLSFYDEIADVVVEGPAA